MNRFIRFAAAVVVAGGVALTASVAQADVMPHGLGVDTMPRAIMPHG